MVALFSVIALVLFSVITFFGNVARWSCFRLSTGPIFGYHTHCEPARRAFCIRPGLPVPIFVSAKIPYFGS